MRRKTQSTIINYAKQTATNMFQLGMNESRLHMKTKMINH